MSGNGKERKSEAFSLSSFFFTSALFFLFYFSFFFLFREMKREKSTRRGNSTQDFLELGWNHMFQEEDLYVSPYWLQKEYNTEKCRRKGYSGNRQNSGWVVVSRLRSSSPILENRKRKKRPKISLKPINFSVAYFMLFFIKCLPFVCLQKALRFTTFYFRLQHISYFLLPFGLEMHLMCLEFV